MGREDIYMRCHSIETGRAAVGGLSFRDAVTIGGSTREIRLRFDDAAPIFWKAWKAIESGAEEDQREAYKRLSALLFGTDAAGIFAAEGQAVFSVWLYHYAETRVLPFMLAGSKALGLVYRQVAACSYPPLRRAFYSAYLRLRMAAAIAIAKKFQ